MTDSRHVICQLVHTLNVGGAEVLAGNLARRLQDRYRFIFVCLDEFGAGAERLREEGFPVEVVGRRDGIDWRCPLQLASILRKHRVELIQAHQYTPFFYSLLARLRFRQPPIVFTEHGRHFPDFPRLKRKIANRMLLQRRDRVVAVGRSVKQALKVNEGIPEASIEVILNGVDTTRFMPSAAMRDEVRNELGVDSSDYLVMMVARLDPIKDHLTAIRSSARAIAAVPGLKLFLVGDGPERQRIESFIKENCLNAFVHLLGTRSDVARLLTGADTLLLTSLSEGIPLTVIEAMATGIPVVSTDVGSVADVIVHYKTGMLAPVRDDGKIASCLIRVGRDSALRVAMGDRGRARAAAAFSETTMANHYATLFDKSLNSSRWC